MNRCNATHVVDRRQVLQGAAAGALSASFTGAGIAASRPAAKSVIFVFLTGGICYIDTFDLKPHAVYHGTPIAGLT